MNKMPFLPFQFFLHTISLTLSTNDLYHYEAFLNQLPMPKSKNQIFDDEIFLKAYKNPKLPSKKYFLSDLVIQQVNLLVFMTIL